MTWLSLSEGILTEFAEAQRIAPAGAGIPAAQMRFFFYDHELRREWWRKASAKRYAALPCKACGERGHQAFDHKKQGWCAKCREPRLPWAPWCRAHEAAYRASRRLTTRAA